MQYGDVSEPVPVAAGKSSNLGAGQHELSPPTPFADSDPSSCCFSKSNPPGGQIPPTTVAKAGEADGGKERQEAARTERHHVFLKERQEVLHDAQLSQRLPCNDYLSPLVTGQH